MDKEKSKYQSYRAAQITRRAEQENSDDKKASSFKRYSPYEGGTEQEYDEWRKSEESKVKHYKDYQKVLSFKGWLDKQKDDARSNAKNASSQIAGMQSQIASLQSQLKKQAGAAPKPKGDMQIDPVQQHSPEIQSAKEKADAWLQGSQNDYSSIFKFDPNQNASGGFDIGGKGSQTSFDPMKYMQDFTGSGMQQKQQNAQTQQVEANAMSANDILKRDKQQGWV